MVNVPALLASIPKKYYVTAASLLAQFVLLALHRKRGHIPVEGALDLLDEAANALKRAQSIQVRIDALPEEDRASVQTLLNQLLKHPRTGGSHG